MAGAYEDVTKLAEELGAAPERVHGEVQRVVAKGALNVKNDWRKRVGGSKSFKHLQFAVGYDMVYDTDAIGAEIGYDKARVQGPLGNIREYGTADTPGHLDGQHALEAEQERFAAALEDAVVKATLP